MDHIIVRRLRRNLYCLILAASAILAQQPTDVYINTQSTAFDLGRHLSWSGSGQNGLNNNFIFRPQNSNSGYCAYLYNENPTSVHSITVQVFNTPDTSAINLGLNPLHTWTQGTFYFGGGGVNYASSTSVNVGANGLAFLGYMMPGAVAYSALSLSGGVSLTGTPDTANVFVVLSPNGMCVGGFNTAAPNGLGAALNSGALRPLGATNQTQASTNNQFGLLVSPMFGLNTNNATTTPVPTQGIIIAEKGNRQACSAIPLTSVVATCGPAAGTGTVRHVVDCIGYSAVSTGATVAADGNVNLTDGASNIIATFRTAHSVAANAGIQTVAPFAVCGLNIVGSATSALTWGFGQANANEIQRVWMTWFDIQ